MFVADEALLDVSFDAARARLAGLSLGGSLVTASQHAYGAGITDLARPGMPDSAPGVRLAEVHLRDLRLRDGSAVLTLRWEVISPWGGLFPALDADMTLSPVGERVTLLRLNGAYRLPPGPASEGLDELIVHRAAEATIQAFLNHVADAIAYPPDAAERELPGRLG